MTQVRPTARIDFDGNRYSVPPRLARKTVVVRANADHVIIMYQAEQVACHVRSYSRREMISLPEHQLAAIELRKRQRSHEIQNSFNALGEQAKAFHLGLLKQPVKPNVHLRRLVMLIGLYGSAEVLAAISLANQYQTYDAAYVETILHQQRRKQSLPSPTSIRPQRSELTEIEIDPPDLSHYDRFLNQD
jgi:hypothetical protein